MNIQTEAIVSLAENGDFGTRVMAVELLHDLVTLGVIRDASYAKAIAILRHKVVISCNDTKSRGVYIAKVIGSEQEQFKDIVLVGQTSNWVSTLDDLRDLYGSIWLIAFIGSENIDEKSQEVWEDWIRSVLKNNRSNIDGTFYLSDRRARELVAAIKRTIDDQSLSVNLFSSPMLTEPEGTFEREFGKISSGLSNPITLPVVDKKTMPEVSEDIKKVLQPISNPSSFASFTMDEVYSTSIPTPSMKTVSFSSTGLPAGYDTIGKQRTIANSDNLWKILGADPTSNQSSIPGKKNPNWFKSLIKRS
jgi:hypothetical protein